MTTPTVLKSISPSCSSCVICFEDFTLDREIKRLACEHFFHKTCIETWLSSQNTCPMCRFRVYQREEEMLVFTTIDIRLFLNFVRVSEDSDTETYFSNSGNEVESHSIFSLQNLSPLAYAIRCKENENFLNLLAHITDSYTEELIVEAFDEALLLEDMAYEFIPHLLEKFPLNESLFQKLIKMGASHRNASFFESMFGKYPLESDLRNGCLFELFEAQIIEMDKQDILTIFSLLIEEPEDISEEMIEQIFKHAYNVRFLQLMEKLLLKRAPAPDCILETIKDLALGTDVEFFTLITKNSILNTIQKEQICEKIAQNPDEVLKIQLREILYLD